MLPYQHFTTCATIQWPLVIFSICNMLHLLIAHSDTARSVSWNPVTVCDFVVVFVVISFFYSFSFILVLSHWQSWLWIWVWHCVSLCWSIFFWHLSWVAFFFVHAYTLYSTGLPCWFPIVTSMRIIFVVYFYLLWLIRLTLFTYNSIIAIRMIILIVRIESAMNDLNKMEQWVQYWHLLFYLSKRHYCNFFSWILSN